MKNFYNQFSRDNIVASFVVFIIALPLSLGIALASGMTPAAGLITAIIGGVVVGLVSGAPLSVSGPAAGLTAFVFQLVSTHGLPAMAVIAFSAGFFQIMFSALKAGRFFLLIPKAVLEGMLAAIGISIVLSQTHVLMGGKPIGSPMVALEKIPTALLQTLTSGSLLPILASGVLGLMIMVLWQRFLGKRSWIPSALPAVFIVTIVSQFWSMPRIEIVPLLPAVTQSIDQLRSFTFLNPQIVTWASAGFALALIGSAESLLTARAVDIIALSKGLSSKTKLDKELFAQGLGNMTSSLCGGMPMTAVMVRSAANINAGAKSRVSAILHGVWIAAFVSFAPGILETIPLTALAAVLIFSGVKLVNLKETLHLFKTGRSQAAVFAITLFAILSTDLLKGLAIGVASFVAIKFAKKISKTQNHEPKTEEDVVSQI